MGAHSRVDAEVDNCEKNGSSNIQRFFSRLEIIFIAMTWSIVAVYIKSANHYSLQKNRFLVSDYSTGNLDERILSLLSDTPKEKMVNPDLEYDEKVFYDEKRVGDIVKSSLITREDYEVCAEVVEDERTSQPIRLCKVFNVFKIRECTYDVNVQDIDCEYSTDVQVGKGFVK